MGKDSIIYQDQTMSCLLKKTLLCGGLCNLCMHICKIFHMFSWLMYEGIVLESFEVTFDGLNQLNQCGSMHMAVYQSLYSCLRGNAVSILQLFVEIEHCVCPTLQMLHYTVCFILPYKSGILKG